MPRTPLPVMTNRMLRPTKGWLAAYVLLAGLASVPHAFGQDNPHWSAAMRDPGLSLAEVDAAFEADSVNIADRGKGFKPYQRWRAFMAPRLDAEGMRASNGVILRALERAEEDRLQESIQRSVNDPTWIHAGPTGPTGLGGNGRLNRLVSRPDNPDE